MTKKRKVTVEGTHVCSEEYGVTTVVSRGVGDGWEYMAKPCPQCPWRKDVPTGVFPPEAFRHSARTAYDMAMNTFACHMSGERDMEKVKTCAGFLHANADHNLGVRLGRMKGKYPPSLPDPGVPLYESYRAMAEANGVDPDDPALATCRANDE